MLLLPLLLDIDDDPSWSAPAKPYRIAANIYAVGTEGIGVYLITTPKGHILIDGATERGAQVVEDNVRSLGFKVGDIKILLETHAHFDHVAGLAKIKKDSKARFYAMRPDAWSLQNGKHDGDTDYGGASYPPVRVDHVIADGGTVSLGGTTLRALATPGHTKGCTSWTMTVRDPKIKSGKPLSVLFFGSATVAGNTLVGNKKYPGIARDYRRTFARFKLVHPDIFLANHPSFADMDEKKARLEKGDLAAFVDRKSFQPFIEDLRQSFESALAKALAGNKKAAMPESTAAQTGFTCACGE